MKRLHTLSLFSALAVIPVLGCATSNPDQDLMGMPRIRTVTGGAVSSGGGDVTRGLAIRYVEEPVLVEDLVAAPRADVLPLLLDALEAEGLSPDGMDASSGVVSVSRMEWTRERKGRPLSAFLECGPSETGRFLADDARVLSSLATQMRQEGPGVTRVTIRLDAAASPLSSLGGAVRGCTSTGALERAILERIHAAVAPELMGPAIQGPEPGARPGPSMPAMEPEATDLPFGPGDHVRIWLSPSERLSGVFLGYQGDTLLMKRSRRTTVPLSMVQAFQVGRTRRLPVLVGSLLGIASGVTVAMNSGLGIGGRHAIQGEILNPGLGAVFGGLVGAGVGYLFLGRSWLDVPLDRVTPGAPGEG